MLLHPIQNKANFTTAWIQVRPYVTQKFGLTKYATTRNPINGKYPYGEVNGSPRPHIGIDLRAKKGTPLFAPMDGEIKFINSGSKGYGKHIKLRSREKKSECVLGHLSEFEGLHRNTVKFGDLIGYSGSTGYSTASHLHFGLRFLIENKNKGVFSWNVSGYDNIYYGYVDPSKYLITWKGTLLENNL